MRHIWLRTNNTYQNDFFVDSSAVQDWWDQYRFCRIFGNSNNSVGTDPLFNRYLIRGFTSVDCDFSTHSGLKCTPHTLSVNNFFFTIIAMTNKPCRYNLKMYYNVYHVWSDDWGLCHKLQAIFDVGQHLEEMNKIPHCYKRH